MERIQNAIKYMTPTTTYFVAGYLLGLVTVVVLILIIDKIQDHI